MTAPYLSLARLIDDVRDRVADAAVERQYAGDPGLLKRYGPQGRTKCRQDAAYHLSYLAESIAGHTPDLFIDYVSWVQAMLTARGIPTADLAAQLRHLAVALSHHLPDTLLPAATDVLDQAIARLEEAGRPVPAVLTDDAPHAALARSYLEALVAYDRQWAIRLVLDAYAGGVSIPELYQHVVQPVQREIGRRWQLNEMSVAHEHYCTATTQLVIAQLYPYLFAGERRNHTLVGACVAGDLHELGIRMVCDRLELAGWDTIYLGANVPHASVIQTLRERDADALAISATMPYHLRAVADLIAAVRGSFPEGAPKIVVGGYPFLTAPGLWQLVDADGVAADAEQAVLVLNRLVETMDRA